MKELDDILKQALTPTEEPDFWTNQKILNQVKENKQMGKKLGKRIPAIVLSASIILAAGSVTAFAAWRYLTPDQVAQNVENGKLSQAFQSEDALRIDETQSYHGYDITLLGVVSGENLTNCLSETKEQINNDRTYSVVAIANSDGTAMPDTSDEAYGKISFFVSALIKGYNPNQYNAVTMRGGYTDVVVEGVLYRISECDNVELFADQGLYLCVNEGTFYNQDAFLYEETTGEICRNESYEGVNALFNLPIDAAKANPKKASEYLNTLEDGENEESKLEEDSFSQSMDEWMAKITPDTIQEYADPVADSVMVYTPRDGVFHTEYYNESGAGVSGDVYMDQVFPEGKLGMSDQMDYSYSEDGLKDTWIYTYELNADGTVTFTVYTPKTEEVEKFVAQ